MKRIFLLGIIALTVLNACAATQSQVASPTTPALQPSALVKAPEPKKASVPTADLLAAGDYDGRWTTASGNRNPLDLTIGSGTCKVKVHLTGFNAPGFNSPVACTLSQEGTQTVISAPGYFTLNLTREGKILTGTINFYSWPQGRVERLSKR